MNQKEVLLMAGTGLISFGMTLLASQVWAALAVIIVGCGVLAFRGWLKDRDI